jgi:2-polyprenyl-3-methyl-5-hydroxy-6-metoxy-1,4-benzoquinol methylase
MRTIHLEPVLAYDHLAAEFAQVSERRRAYLNAIEQIIISEIPRGSESLLDVGAGDGSRAYRIAQAASIKDVVLLEPSAGMRKHWPSETGHWPIEAAQLREQQTKFDVITCLWNTLGHIIPAESRVEVLRACARLLATDGRLFIDVSNRYNARHYGVLPTLYRMLRDLVLPGTNNGDVTVGWIVEGTRYTTAGHVFTQTEFGLMARSAGLEIARQFSVDYATGRLCRSPFAGHSLYLLQPERIAAIKS